MRRKILALAWPAVLEMMLYMLLDIVDVAFVGRLGARPLAAVSLGAQIYFTVLFVFSALSTGATTLIARAIGAGDRDLVSRVAGKSLMLALLVGVAVTVAARTCSEAILIPFHFEPAVKKLAAAYIRTAGSAAVFAMLLFVSNGIFRGAGLTKIPMLVAGITNVIHIGAEYLLVFGRLGLPAYGAVGSALATALAQVFGCLVTLTLLWSGMTPLRARMRDLLRPGGNDLVLKVIRLSLPAGLEEAMMDAGRVVGSVMLAPLGTIPFAAHEVANVAESLSFMPGYGFAVAATALVGQSLGAGNPRQAGHCAREAAKMALVVMGGVALAFLLFPSAIVRLFSHDPGVVGLGALCLRIAVLEQPSIALSMVLSGALRGAGDTRTPMLVTLASTWLLRIPLFYLAVYVFAMGLPAIWVITALDWLTRACLAGYWFRKGAWQKVEI